MPGETDHYLGGTKHFECRVKGHPRPDIRWFKNSREITYHRRYKFDHSQDGIISMVIENITHGDEGHYRCRAENTEGIASTSVYLIVREHKEHPEEAKTSIHSMQIEEVVVFGSSRSAKQQHPQKKKASEPHFETPIEDVDETPSEDRRLSLEEEELVKKTFDSVIENATTTRPISPLNNGVNDVSKNQNGKPENDSAKIRADLSEKVYQPSDDSGEDADSIKLRTISERSETSRQESLNDLDGYDSEKSLLMQQTERIFSEIRSSDSQRRLSKSDSFSSGSQSASSKKESTKMVVESTSSRSKTSMKTESISEVTSTISVEESTTSGKMEMKSEVRTSSRRVETAAEETRTSNREAKSGQDGIDGHKEENKTSGESSLSDSSLTNERLKQDESRLSTENSKATESVEDTGQSKASSNHEKDGIVTTKDEEGPQTNRTETAIAGEDGIMEDGYTESETGSTVDSVVSMEESSVKKDEIDGKLKTNQMDVDGTKERRDRKEDKQPLKGEGAENGDNDEIKSKGKESVEQTKSSWVDQVTAEAEVEKKSEAPTEEEGKKEEKKKKDEQKKKPQLVQSDDDVSVTEGQILRLRTAVEGSPRPNVTWSKAGEILQEGERITIITETDVYSLEIRDATSEDSGTYRMTARNSAGEIFSDIQVNVLESEVISTGPDDHQLRLSATVTVPEFLTRPQDVDVAEFEPIKLSCSFQGDPTPSVSWTKDGKKLRSNRHVRVYEDRGVNYVEIKDSEAEDAGTYTCNATNVHGTVSASVHVSIEGYSTVSDSGDAEDIGLTAAAPPIDEDSATAATSDSQTALEGAVGGDQDVGTLTDSTTVRYIKLFGAAAAFSLAAFGVKRILDNLHK